MSLFSGKRYSYTKDFKNIVHSITSNIDLDNLLGDLIPKLLKYTKSICGAFYLANNAAGKLELKYSVGFSKNIYHEFDFTIGEGMIGIAADKKEISIISDIPEDSFFVTKTFLGKIVPKNVMMIPAIANDQLLGVLVLSSLYRYEKKHIGLINTSKIFIGSAIFNSIAYERSKRQANESNFNDTLLQDFFRESEKKDKQKTEYLNMVLNGIENSAIYVIDKDAKILFWNELAAELWDFKKENFLGTNIIDFFSGKNYAKSSIYHHKLNCAIRDGKYVEKCWRKKKDGSLFFTETTLLPIRNNDNEVVIFMNLTRDLTNQINIQHEVSSLNSACHKLVEFAPSALIVTDENFKVKFANRHALNLMVEEVLLECDFCTLFTESSNLYDFLKNSGTGEKKSFAKQEGTGLLTVHAPIRTDSKEDTPKLIICLEEES